MARRTSLTGNVLGYSLDNTLKEVRECILLEWTTTNKPR